MTLHYFALHYTTLHYIIYHTIPYHAMPCHTIPFHTIPYHYILTLHYITLHCITLHYHTYIHYIHTCIYIYMYGAFAHVHSTHTHMIMHLYIYTHTHTLYIKGSAKKIEKNKSGCYEHVDPKSWKPTGKIDPNFWVKFWDKNHANMGDSRMDAGSTYSWWILKIEEKPQWKTWPHNLYMPNLQ